MTQQGDYSQDVEDLAVEHRAKQALRRLMAAGPLATPMLRRGLTHPNAAVRAGRCIVLDHYLDEAALPELIANLQHDDEGVRRWALHALACDRCKEGECRPSEHDVLPITVRMLREDPSRRVRAEAVALLGRSSVVRRPDVMSAIECARDADPDPNVRKIARRYSPGGAIYERQVSGIIVSQRSGARRPYPRRKKRSGSPV